MQLYGFHDVIVELPLQRVELSGEPPHQATEGQSHLVDHDSVPRLHRLQKETQSARAAVLQHYWPHPQPRPQTFQLHSAREVT